MLCRVPRPARPSPASCSLTCCWCWPIPLTLAAVLGRTWEPWLCYPLCPSAPSIEIPVLCLAEVPEPLGPCRAMLLPGTRLPQEADPAAAAQPCHAAAVPAPLLSAKAQSQESSTRARLEEEDTPSLPSVLTLQLQHSTLPAEHWEICDSCLAWALQHPPS